MRFWDVVREVSTQGVKKEADRLFLLALAGDPDAVHFAREAALGYSPTPGQVAAAEPFLYCASPPYTSEDDRRLRQADLIVSLPGGPGLTEFRPADTIQVAWPQGIVERVLDHREDLRVALGRRLPGFRKPAAEMVIRDVSRINAQFAALSGLSESIPWLIPLFPVLIGADLVMITKNQVLMVYRLAAVYGEDYRFVSRLKEATGVIGGGFGWRAIARQAAGFIPGGFGVPLKAAISYAGTYAVGRALQMVFDEGRRPTQGEMRKIYEDGRRLALDAANSLRSQFRKGRTEEPSPKTLTEGTELTAEHAEDAEDPDEEAKVPAE